MGLKPRQVTSPPPDQNGWQESSVRFPQDIILRDNGFAIHSREEGKIPKWIKGEVIFSQLEALKKCSREKAKGRNCEDIE